MGSSQSSPEAQKSPQASQTLDSASTPATAAATNTVDDHDAKEKNAAQKSNNSKPKVQRSGIDLVNYRCRKKKAVYDKCVSNWYHDRFLQGKSINQEEECGEVFEIYKQCYMKNIKREFFDKGEKKPKEGSMLAEELDE